MFGGIRVIAIYADRLRRRGHEVTVVSLPKARQSLLAKAKSLVRGRGWPKDPEPGPSYFDDIDVPHRVLEAARPVVDNDVPDADIVLATFWKTGPWVAALSPRKGVKAILLQGHEISPGRENPNMDAAWRLPLHKIVISKWLQELARDQFGDSNVHLIPNSVDMAQFHSPVREKQNVPVVGFLYSTAHLKGVDVTLAVLEQVRRQFGNLRVIAFGAERISVEIPLPNWVEFHYLPPQDQIRQLYQQCDVWLCGSRCEGFHLPPLEAMACRCPVVSTRVGGPMDTIQDGVNGFLADVDDRDGLADRVLSVLMLDASEWRRMSGEALETARRYSWDDATDLFESALHDILAGVPSPSV
jgi:glycosyltransferase involved in cell wall biosynthesis